MSEKGKKNLQRMEEHLKKKTEEDKEIQKEAKNILENGDPIEYILNVHQKLHLGDVELAKTLLISVGCQSIANTEGIHPKITGESGKGKSHCCMTMIHLLPPEYAIEATLSSKAIYYMNIKPGTVVYSDDTNLTPEMEDMIKRATTNYQKITQHITVKKQEPIVVTIPPRISWWLTSVDSMESLQYLNRTFGGSVEEDEEKDLAVLEFQKKQAVNGAPLLPETREVLVCREIIRQLKEHVWTVAVPYAEKIIWLDHKNRRNFPIFLDILKSHAVFFFKQRKCKDGIIYASREDFEFAKALYAPRAENQGLKLTELEREVVKYLARVGSATAAEIAEALGKSVTRVRYILKGRRDRGDSGLLGKIVGLSEERVLLDVSLGKKVTQCVYRLSGFDDPFALYENMVVDLSESPNSPLNHHQNHHSEDKYNKKVIDNLSEKTASSSSSSNSSSSSSSSSSNFEITEITKNRKKVKEHSKNSLLDNKHSKNVSSDAQNFSLSHKSGNFGNFGDSESPDSDLCGDSDRDFDGDSESPAGSKLPTRFDFDGDSEPSQAEIMKEVYDEISSYTPANYDIAKNNEINRLQKDYGIPEDQACEIVDRVMEDLYRRG